MSIVSAFSSAVSLPLNATRFILGNAVGLATAGAAYFIDKKLFDGAGMNSLKAQWDKFVDDPIGSIKSLINRARGVTNSVMETYNSIRGEEPASTVTPVTPRNDAPTPGGMN